MRRVGRPSDIFADGDGPRGCWSRAASLNHRVGDSRLGLGNSDPLGRGWLGRCREASFREVCKYIVCVFKFER